MAKENALTRALDKTKAPKVVNVRVEGRFLMYVPTMAQNPEIKTRGGRWDGRAQCWRIPKLTREAKFLMKYDPDATWTPGARFIAEGDWEKRDSEVGQAFELSKHFANLYPFQKLAALSLFSRGYHGELLALSPGLGKTPTSIVAGDIYMNERRGEERALVVAPLSLVPNWTREIAKWSDYDVQRKHQEGPDPSVRWTVTNYDTILERKKNSLGTTEVTGNLHPDYDADWDLVIFDESVLMKNRKSKRVSACRTLARAANKVWLLSGSPITRGNEDIWSQFNIMEPDYFSSFWRLVREMCIVVQTPWSQGEIAGNRKSFVIRDEFPELMFVRNQEQVLPDLPDYIFQDIPLELTPRQARAHKEIMDDWFHALEAAPEKKVEVTVVIAMLIRLQQITSNLYNLETTGHEWPDESVKADFVQETLDMGDIEWPVLIWTHHRPGAKALKERLQKLTKKKDSAMYGRRVELVYGGVKDADSIIESYKAGDVDVLILGIQVGKYGHTLVNTRTVITYDKTWDSDAWFQMLHRVRRNGLRHRPLVLNPRCRGTVDDFVELNLAGKLPAMANLTGASLAKILRSLGEDHV